MHESKLLEVCRNNDWREMTSHKNARMFRQGRCHTIYVKGGPKMFTEFLSVTVPFIWDTSSMINTNTGNYCTRRNFIHGRCQIQLWTKENGHTDKFEYKLKISCFSRGPTRKITSTLIQGLDRYF